MSTKVTCKALSAQHSEDYEAPRTTSTQYGYVIWIGDGDSEESELEDLKKRGASPGLLRTIKLAHDAGVFMINIDQDAT